MKTETENKKEAQSKTVRPPMMEMGYPIIEIVRDILEELRRARAQNDELWEAQDIADYLRLSKKTVQNDVLSSTGFPTGVVLPTGGRRWVSKDVRAWVIRRR